MRSLNISGPELLVHVHKNFGVGLGVEAMPPRFKIRTQLGVVEDLPVEHDPDSFVLVVDRLVPAAQIDDAQPGVGETRGPIDIDDRWRQAPGAG